MKRRRRSVTKCRYHTRKAEGEHASPEYTAVGPPIAAFAAPVPDRHGADLARRGLRYEDVRLKQRGGSNGRSY